MAGLLAKGEAQICRKIGEEAVEVMTAALGGEGDDRVVSEVADLWFHTMVLLSARGIPLRRVFEELARRHAEGKCPGSRPSRAILVAGLSRSPRRLREPRRAASRTGCSTPRRATG